MRIGSVDSGARISVPVPVEISGLVAHIEAFNLPDTTEVCSNFEQLDVESFTPESFELVHAAKPGPYNHSIESHNVRHIGHTEYSYL